MRRQGASVVVQDSGTPVRIAFVDFHTRRTDRGLLVDLQVQLRQVERQAARKAAPKRRTTTSASSGRAMEEVGKVAGREGLCSLWKTWAWLLGNMAST